jgi:PemK-like, MazF-like toxin of type II toxin-antitoxin system
MTGWPTPAPGDIVWCHFPFLPATGTEIERGPKPRPALIVGVRTYENGVTVQVAYATTRRTSSLRSGEFLISKDKHPVAFKQAGLAFDTKFDLNKVIELPWTDRYFKVPPMPNPAFGQTPKMGSLHASRIRALVAAHEAVRK